MAWTGSICDEELARKSAGSALAGQNILAVQAASLSSVAVAQAASTALGAAMSICDQIWTVPVNRGYQIASNMGGAFSSNYTTLYASLPSSSGHVRQMIQS